MRIAAVLFVVGVAALCWLKRTRRLDDAPKWKPDRPITDNRNRQ